MTDEERNRLDGPILRAAKPYEAFIDAVLAHARDAFLRGAKQVRIVFYPQGAMSISDDGRELTERQFHAMTTLRENTFTSTYERLGLAFVPHAAWLEVFSGSRKNQTRLPSTEGFRQISEHPKTYGNVTVMFHEARFGDCNSMTVLRLLPPKLTPSKVARVTVVDARGVEWKLGKVKQDVLAKRIVTLPDSFETKRASYRQKELMLEVDRVRVPLRDVLARRQPFWNDEGVEAFMPLASPWLTGTIRVSRKDGETEFQAVADDFPSESYADGTVDAILGEIDKERANARAQVTIGGIATDLHACTFKNPFTVRGKTYRVEPPGRYGNGIRSAWLAGSMGESGIHQIQFDPLHPVFQADAKYDAIVERLLWCVTDLIRGDAPAKVIYLELRAALDAARKS